MKTRHALSARSMDLIVGRSYLWHHGWTNVKSTTECAFLRTTTIWKPPGRKRASSKLSQLANDLSKVNNQAPEKRASIQSNTESPVEAPSLVSDSYSTVEKLARDGLMQFFHDGIESTEWLTFGDLGHIRLAYTGTSSSNLTHLVNLKQAPTATLHYPYPPTRPISSWKPENICNFGENSNIVHDISSLPAREIRDAMVDAFFEKIHPIIPILDEKFFRSQYSDPSKPPPLLLLQAVLLVGAQVCDHPLVAKSRALVKGVLFRRANMLFHIRHEADRLHLMQAALLFTWHLESADTVSEGSYYWVGVACRIGFGLGVHRDVSLRAESRLPMWERRLYRRVWWTTFQVEVFSCLEHGRPSMINLADVDQPLPEVEDFIEGRPGAINQNVQFDHFLRNINLCLIVVDILTLDVPSPHRLNTHIDASSIDSRLAEWGLNLPHADNVWSSLLRLHYNLVLLYRHRTISVGGGDTCGSNGNSRDICIEAAQSITACLEKMTSEGTIGQCSFTAVTALTAAVIHTANDVKIAISKGLSLVALGAQNRLSRLLRCAESLEEFWPNAGAVHRLLEHLLREFTTLISRGVRTQSQTTQLDSPSMLETGLDWYKIFDTLEFPQLPEHGTQGWIESVDWMDA